MVVLQVLNTEYNNEFQMIKEKTNKQTNIYRPSLGAL